MRPRPSGWEKASTYGCGTEVPHRSLAETTSLLASGAREPVAVRLDRALYRPGRSDLSVASVVRAGAVGRHRRAGRSRQVDVRPPVERGFRWRAGDPHRRLRVVGRPDRVVSAAARRRSSNLSRPAGLAATSATTGCGASWRNGTTSALTRSCCSKVSARLGVPSPTGWHSPSGSTPPPSCGWLAASSATARGCASFGTRGPRPRMPTTPPTGLASARPARRRFARGAARRRGGVCPLRDHLTFVIMHECGSYACVWYQIRA